MIGAYVMRQSDCQRKTIKPDSAAMGTFIWIPTASRGWSRPREWRLTRATSTFPSGRTSRLPQHHAPRGACENLLVPVCLSASHVAYGSIRMSRRA